MQIVNLQDENYLEAFTKFWFDFQPYSYQKRFLKECLTSNRVAGIWCRQSGKSQTVAVYSLAKCLIERTTILIIAPTQSQSRELYNKVRELAMNRDMIKAQIVKSTETEMRFENGSRIISLPSGPTGATIRGYTADIVILEEAQGLKDGIVNTVITPMLASKKDKGQLIKIGTGWIKNHFYHSCVDDKKYKVVKVNWKEVVEAGQYSEEFINEQKANLMDIEFQTEYGAEFITDINSFFPSQLVESCCDNYDLWKND